MSLPEAAVYTVEGRSFAPGPSVTPEVEEGACQAAERILVEPGGALRVGIGDFGLTSSSDVSVIRVRPGARFSVEGGEQVRRQAPNCRLPTLLLYAGADRCVAPRGSEAFASAAPNAVVTAHCYAPLFHEIFNEPEQGEVLGRLRRWLVARPH